MSRLTSDQLARMKIVLMGGEGSGNFGHAGRPGKVGGSASSRLGNKKVESIADLKKIVDVSLPSDNSKYEYFYHSVRYRSDIDEIERHGFSGTKIYLSKDEIRDRGSGFFIVRVPKGKAKEGKDFVEKGLVYREWTVDSIPKEDIVRVVREIPTGIGNHTIREDELARWAIEHQGEDTSDLPDEYKHWFTLGK